MAFNFGAIDLAKPVSNDPLNSGLVSWWLSLPNANVSSVGGQWYDINSTYDATLAADAKITASYGVNNFSVLSLDGTGDQAACPNIPGLSLLSIAAVVKTSTSGRMGIFDRDNGTSARVWQFRKNSSNQFNPIFFNTGGTPGQSTSSATLNSGTWRFVCATWDGTTVRGYVDGIADGTAALSGTLNTGTLAPIWGGGYQSGTGNANWNGEIAAGWVYNRALTASEVFGLYEQWKLGYPKTLNRRQSILYSFAGDSATPATGGTPIFNSGILSSRIISGGGIVA